VEFGLPTPRRISIKKWKFLLLLQNRVEEEEEGDTVPPGRIMGLARYS